MDAIHPQWLVHGRFNFSDVQRGHRSLAVNIRDELSALYSVKFDLRMWPQRGFKNVLWWSERHIPSRYGAAYFLRIADDRGPTLYAGINVEKGFEARDLADRWAKERGGPASQYILSPSWDWHRAVAALPGLEHTLHDASAALAKELYCWVEFRGRERDERYFVVTPDALYRRGKFKPVRWNKLPEFVSKPRPRLWGRLAIARAFSVPDCTPELELPAVLDVFKSLRRARDVWRGVTTT